MSVMLQPAIAALTEMGLAYGYSPECEGLIVGIEFPRGEQIHLMIRGNDLAHDLVMCAPLGSVNPELEAGVAQLLAKELNAKFKCVTYSLVDGNVVVDHVVDLEFTSDATRLIQKGLVRIATAIDAALPSLARVANTHGAGCTSTVIREAAQVLDDLGFA